MARLWESSLHFEPTINCLTLRPVCPEYFAPRGRVVSHFAAPALQLYPTPVVVAAPGHRLCLVQDALLLHRLQDPL